MEIYHTQISRLTGTDYREINRRARDIYLCALDLVKNSHVKPTMKVNPNRHSEMLYRFLGMTKNKETYAVQIKEDLKRKEKHLISIFPIE